MEESYNARGYRPVMLMEAENQCTGCAVCAVVCPDVVFTVYRLPQPLRAGAGAGVAGKNGGNGARI